MVRMIARALLVLCTATMVLLGLCGCADILLRQVVEDLVTEYKLGYLPGWSEPEVLADMPGSPQELRAAIGAGDRAYVVWMNYVASPQDYSVYVNRYEGGMWVGPQEIDSPLRPTTGTAFMPDVAVGADGYAFVLLGQEEGTEQRPYVRRFQGGAWSAGGYLDASPDSRYLRHYLRVGMNPAGKTVALWIEQDGAGSDVKARVRPDTVTDWQPEVALENPDGWADYCDLTVASDGTAIAAWHLESSGSYSLHANRFDGTSWVGAQQVEAAAEGFLRPQVAVSETGTAVAVWVRYDATVDLYAARFNGTSWGAPVVLDSLTSPAEEPSVAMAPDGKALVVWMQNDGIASNVYSSFFNGVSWGAPVTVEHSDELVAEDSTRVAFAPDGTAIAVWTGEISGSYGAVCYNHFDGSAWGQEAKLPLPDGEYADEQSLHLDISSEGHAVLAWVSYVQATFDWKVYAALYRP